MYVHTYIHCTVEETFNISPYKPHVSPLTVRSETLLVSPIQFRQHILRRLCRIRKPKGFSLLFFSVGSVEFCTLVQAVQAARDPNRKHCTMADGHFGHSQMQVRKVKSRGTAYKLVNEISSSLGNDSLWLTIVRWNYTKKGKKTGKIVNQMKPPK